MKISNEIIQKLQPLKGINLDIAYKIFAENRLDVKSKGFVENLVALLIDRDLPKNDRGMDFKGLFEVKEIKVSFTKRKNEMRTGGDTAISAYLDSEPNFFDSNIWDKSKSILIICVDENRDIVDIRFFDGEPYASQMKNDYESIIKMKNLCRKNNQILVFKTGRNSIMIKGNKAIDMSKSVISVEDNNIEDQDAYIRNLFNDKFASYQRNIKSLAEKIIDLMNRVSISELEMIKKYAETKIVENVGFDRNAGSELPF
jgi:hypothetical protein